MLDQMNFLLVQSQSRLEQEQKDMETLTENIAEDQQDQNSSQDDNVIPKKR